MPIANNVTQLIGNTPIVKLHKVVLENSATVLAKLESKNPGGSVKDRIALAMVQAAEKAGLLRRGGTIVESTSGNTGISLAMLAAVRGYHCILTMPDSLPIERRRLLAAYGAEIVLTPAAKGMSGAVAKAQEIAKYTPGCFMPLQFENPANPEVHRQTTAQEIWSATAGQIDAFVCAVGTGGTISGVADVMKRRNPLFTVIAVEPAESPVISGGKHTPHQIHDIGFGFVPKNLEIDLLDGIELVSTEEAEFMRRRLITEEGIMAGISSGASVCAAVRVAAQMGPGKTVVTMIHDTGERYINMG